MTMKLKLFFAAGACCLISACGVQDAINSANGIPPKLDKTNKSMEDMLAKLHDQSLAIPLDDLRKEENHDVLTPVPFKMIPYGQKFAEAATASELMDLTYLWLKEVDEGLPDKDIDETTGEEVPYTKKQIAHINHEKTALLVALQVVAGTTPQAVVDEIIQDQIIGSSTTGSRRYEETAYSFLMLRTIFIRDVFLHEGVLSKPLDNTGAIEKATEYARSIDVLARQRFTDKISFKSHGLLGFDGKQLPVDEQPQEQFDKNIAAQLWQNILGRAQSDLRVVERQVGRDESEDKKIFAQERQRAQQDLSVLESYVKYWQGSAR